MLNGNDRDEEIKEKKIEIILPKCRKMLIDIFYNES